MLLFAIAAGTTYAQAPARSEPLAPPPPPPPDVLGSEDLEPQVTINRTDEQTTEEVRVGGQLRYVRVTPRYGRPFYLIPDQNGTMSGALMRARRVSRHLKRAAKARQIEAKAFAQVYAQFGREYEANLRKVGKGRAQQSRRGFAFA